MRALCASYRLWQQHCFTFQRLRWSLLCPALKPAPLPRRPSVLVAHPLAHQLALHHLAHTGRQPAQQSGGGVRSGVDGEPAGGLAGPWQCSRQEQLAVRSGGFADRRECSQRGQRSSRMDHTPHVTVRERHASRTFCLRAQRDERAECWHVVSTLCPATRRIVRVHAQRGLAADSVQLQEVVVRASEGCAAHERPAALVVLQPTVHVCSLRHQGTAAHTKQARERMSRASEP